MSYITHFDDLCELVGYGKPAHLDKTGEVFTYQTGIDPNIFGSLFERAGRRRPPGKEPSKTSEVLAGDQAHSRSRSMLQAGQAIPNVKTSEVSQERAIAQAAKELNDLRDA